MFAPIRILCLLAILVPGAALSDSNFVRLNLQRGFSLEVPRDWRILTDDENKMIDLSAEAVARITSIDLPDGEEATLLAMNSMPANTYAAIRVSSIRPAEVHPDEVRAITQAELKQLDEYFEAVFRELLPHQGNQLLAFVGTHLGEVEGYPAIIVEYRRSGPRGPVFVQISQIYTPSQELRINLSHREQEAGIWGPVIDVIRSSIRISE